MGLCGSMTSSKPSSLRIRCWPLPPLAQSLGDIIDGPVSRMSQSAPAGTHTSEGSCESMLREGTALTSAPPPSVSESSVESWWAWGLMAWLSRPPRDSASVWGLRGVGVLFCRCIERELTTPSAMQGAPGTPRLSCISSRAAKFPASHVLLTRRWPSVLCWPALRASLACACADRIFLRSSAVQSCLSPPIPDSSSAAASCRGASLGLDWWSLAGSGVWGRWSRAAR